MGILEKIAEIEKEIARTQKNKGSARRLICLSPLMCAMCVERVKHFSIDYSLKDSAKF